MRRMSRLSGVRKLLIGTPELFRSRDKETGKPYVLELRESCIPSDFDVRVKFSFFRLQNHDTLRKF